MDGYKEVNNFLVIGMTNRLDLIDDALVRSGRFDVKIEITLPDKKGRYQIFDIHTSDMKKYGVLDKSVKLDVLVEKTPNYSGAEIADVCRAATSFALNKNIDFHDMEKTMKKIAELADAVKIRMSDFEKAIREVKPAFGVKNDDFKFYLKEDLIEYGPRFTKIKNDIKSFISQTLESSRQHFISICLEGKDGCGKTSLAVHLACSTTIPFVKMISPYEIAGMTELGIREYIIDVFSKAYKSKKSIILLDDLEGLINYIPEGPRFLSTVLQTLRMVLKRPSPDDRKLVILGTTSMKNHLRSVGLIKNFNLLVNIPLLSKSFPQEIEKVLLSTQYYGEKNLKEIVESIKNPVGIKDLLLVSEMSTGKMKIGEEISLKVFEETLENLSTRK